MKKESYRYIFILGAILLFPFSSFGMTFYAETMHSLYGVNDTIIVDIFLDADDTVINTVEGEIQFTPGTVDVLDIIDGNSSILFWVDKPIFNEDAETILFSGITPGGISGERIFLFSVEIQAKKLTKNTTLSFNSGTVFLHNGEGVGRLVSFIPKNIYISEDPLFSNQSPIPLDREAPEDFTPSITQDENLYDGKYVLIFATQDKSSGIAYYEIKEGYLGRYTLAESPYVLKDQKSFKTIFVRAVDEAGNERVAIVHPQEKLFDENFILIFSILVVVIISSIVYRKKRS